MSITIKVVSLNPTHYEVYTVICGRSMVFFRVLQLPPPILILTTTIYIIKVLLNTITIIIAIHYQWEFLKSLHACLLHCVPDGELYIIITVRLFYLWRSYCPFWLRIFHQKFVTHKFFYILNGNYKVYFSKVTDISSCVNFFF